MSREMRTRFRRLWIGVFLGCVLTFNWPAVAHVAIPVFLIAFLVYDLWADWREAGADRVEGAE